MDLTRADIEDNRALARLQRELAMETKRISMDEMSHASRWVMASVLAINSGGMIAAISKLDTFELWGVASIITFYLGVVTALTMGWAQVSMNQRLLPIHSKSVIFWETAAIDGHLGDITELEAIRDELVEEGRKGLLSGSLGKWAFALFSIGLLFLAMSLNGDESPKIETADAVKVAQ